MPVGAQDRRRRRRLGPSAAVAVAVAAVGLAGCGSATTAKLPADAPGITGLAKASAGDCVTWDQGAGPRPQARVVDCSAPHLAELTGTTSLSGLGSRWPGTTAIAAAAGRACPSNAAHYLGHPVDPEGAYGTSALYPTEADWDAGAHVALCDLVARSGTAGATLTATTGRVADAAARPLFPTGTCLSFVGASAEAVACKQTHEVEVSGDATAPRKAALPATYDAWEPLVGNACATAAATYLQGALVPGYTSGWLALPAASWDAGRRLVTCLVGRQMDNGQWEPTTGTLRSSHV